jgi:AP endonuclease 2
VYADLKDKVIIEGKEVCTLDILNPPGMFRDGIRVHQWTTKNLLPMSGKLIPEFDRRRNIRDMFSRKPSLATSPSSNGTFPNGSAVAEAPHTMPAPAESLVEQPKPLTPSVLASSMPATILASKNSAATKRSQKETSQPIAKRVKGASQPSNAGESKKGQKSLKGFFQPKPTSKPKPVSQPDGVDGVDEERPTVSTAEKQEALETTSTLHASSNDTLTPSPARSEQSTSNDSIIDPIVSKESWGKLFIKPASPKCEHDEPCKTMLTKKTGVNCGRSFWMCARPLGPSGNKEKATEWRCGTFIWASDWNGGG